MKDKTGTQRVIGSTSHGGARPHVLRRSGIHHHGCSGLREGCRYSVSAGSDPSKSYPVNHREANHATAAASDRPAKPPGQAKNLRTPSTTS